MSCARPLNAILGYTELILDNIYGDIPDKMREMLERIQANGKHLLGLINDVLDLSKIEAGQLTLSLVDYSIKDVVHNVYGAVESLATAKNLALKVDVPKELPQAHGDERRLTQVLLNLVGNAIKFTDNGEVAITHLGREWKLHGRGARHRTGYRRAGPGQDFRGVPAGRFLDDQAERRHRARACDCQAHHRDARRPHLGRVRRSAKARHSPSRYRSTSNDR